MGMPPFTTFVGFLITYITNWSYSQKRGLYDPFYYFRTLEIKKACTLLPMKSSSSCLSFFHEMIWPPFKRTCITQLNNKQPQIWHEENPSIRPSLTPKQQCPDQGKSERKQTNHRRRSCGLCEYNPRRSITIINNTPCHLLPTPESPIQPPTQPEIPSFQTPTINFSG